MLFFYLILCQFNNFIKYIIYASNQTILEFFPSPMKVGSVQGLVKH